MPAAPSPFRVDVEPAALLSSAQELAVLRAAFRRQPGSPLLRGRLATALVVRDLFDDAIALLGEAGALDPDEAALLVQAHLSRETAADNRRAAAIVDRLLPDIGDDDVRAQFLADRAKAHRRLGDHDAARADLEQALRLDPANKDACKRLAAMGLATGDPGATLAVLDGLAAGGAAHARLHAARALAEAQAGRIEASREAVGFDALHHAGTLPVPPGQPSLQAFNDALAAELLAHPDLYYERYGTASEKTWRIDAPALGGAPMVGLLLDGIARAAETHVAALVQGQGRGDHPWLRDRPERGLLHSWCVMTDAVGHETWHVHQFGWMSGVYYVRVPDAVAAGDDARGCIAFGLPEDLAGVDAATRYGTKVVRPQEGMLMLFPSHSYHRTFPHGAAERRICLAFDIWPA